MKKYRLEVKIWRPQQGAGGSFELSKAEAEELRLGLMELGIPEKDIRIVKIEDYE